MLMGSHSIWMVATTLWMMGMGAADMMLSRVETRACEAVGHVIHALCAVWHVVVLGDAVDCARAAACVQPVHRGTVFVGIAPKRGP